MDLNATIQVLIAEKRRLDKLIASVEKLALAGALPSKPARSNRGRKSMGVEERKLVSERMHRYWDAKRQAAQKPPEAQSERK